jgi:hypothetical protein
VLESHKREPSLPLESAIDSELRPMHPTTLQPMIGLFDPTELHQSCYVVTMQLSDMLNLSQVPSLHQVD